MIRKVYLLIFIILLLNCDPGWQYVLKNPVSETINEKYLITTNDINLNILSRDFALVSRIELTITTTKDRTTIYPKFAYFSSIHFNKIRIPDNIDIDLKRNGKKEIDKSYSITLQEETKSKFVDNQLLEWENNKINIEETNLNSELPKATQKSIKKDVLLSPITIDKNDSLVIYFRFRSFALDDKSIWPSGKKSGFIMHYEVEKGREPLQLMFEYRRN